MSNRPYKFKVPDLPGCDKCFFIWNWFNKAGNREMYQNAAVVSISGTAKQFVGPQIYRANTFGDGICETTEGDEVVFPAPGDQVFYAAGTSANSPPTEIKCPGWENKKMVTVTGPGNGPKVPATGGGATGTQAKGPAKTSTNNLQVLPGTGTETGTRTVEPPKTEAAGATTKPTPLPTTASGSSVEDDTATGSAEDPALPSTTGVETPTTGAGTDDSDAVPLAESGDNDRAFLLFAGGLVALIVLAAVAVCLFHRRHRRRHPSYRSAHSDDDEDGGDDSESPSDRPRRRRGQRRRQAHSGRRRHRKEKSTSESSTGSTD